MTEVIQVPVEFQGVPLKAAFLLFTGWTPEERRGYAEFLREYRDEYVAWIPTGGRGPFITLHSVMDHFPESKYKKTMLETLDNMRQQTLCGVSIGSDEAKKTFYLRWLDMQIGMVDVREITYG